MLCAKGTQAGARELVSGSQVALYPAFVASVTASDSTPLAWKGDLLALGVFEEAITPGKGEGNCAQHELLWRLRRRAAVATCVSESCTACTAGRRASTHRRTVPRASQHAGHLTAVQPLPLLPLASQVVRCCRLHEWGRAA